MLRGITWHRAAPTWGITRAAPRRPYLLGSRDVASEPLLHAVGSEQPKWRQGKEPRRRWQFIKESQLPSCNSSLEITGDFQSQIMVAKPSLSCSRAGALPGCAGAPSALCAGTDGASPGSATTTVCPSVCPSCRLSLRAASQALSPPGARLGSSALRALGGRPVAEAFSSSSRCSGHV